MSQGDTRPLASARRVAEALVAALSPACERIEIAGSIRRQKERIGDVELVAIPKFLEVAPPPPPQGALFDAPAPAAYPRVNAVWQAIEDLGRDAIQPLKPGAPEMEPDTNWPKKRAEGSKYFRLWLPRTAIKVDLFFADAATWGAIFTIRTGSADFSRGLVTRWTRRTGGHCQEGRLTWPGGRVEDTPEEVDFFSALRLVWTPPRWRNGEGDFVELSAIETAEAPRG